MKIPLILRTSPHCDPELDATIMLPLDDGTELAVWQYGDVDEFQVYELGDGGPKDITHTLDREALDDIGMRLAAHQEWEAEDARMYG